MSFNVGWASPTSNDGRVEQRAKRKRQADKGQCSSWSVRKPSRTAERRGVILLVVMVLLALMTLMGLTLVMITAQGRLSALAGARDNLQTEHDGEELVYTRTQVIAGSIDPNSTIGAHGLLEDLYGLPQFFGQIMPDTGVPTVLPIGETAAGATVLAGGKNGTFLQLLVMPGNVNSATGNAIGLSGAGNQTLGQYALPQNSGAFCGQVITMITGPAAGQSARVVGYYYNAAVGGNSATMMVSSLGGVVPKPGDQFMINGRPFSGTGFGLNLQLFNPSGTPGVWTPPTANFPLLSAYENISANFPGTTQANAQPQSSQYYAYMPNHARLALSTYVNGLPGYWDPAGPGGANEPYDAPDFQNLMLAMHYYSPFLLPAAASGTSAPVGVITPIPSLHRPELVAWFYNQAIINGTPGISMGNPNDGNGGQSMLSMRRKVILRPEPTDNYFVDGSNGCPVNGVWDAREPFHDVNGNGTYDVGDVYADGTLAFLDLNGDGSWTPGETDYSGNTFNPVTGCWYIAANGGWALDTNAGLDVDNDKDGTADSIWVDAGLPVHKEADGTLTKNFAAILCIDLDGKVNINATGTLAQLDLFRYPGSSISGPLAGGTGSTSLYSDGMFQRNLPVGQGYGPADVNPLHLFVRSHTATAATPYYTYSNGSAVSGTAHSFYKTFLQGYDYQTFLASYNGYTVAPTIPVMQVDGRYGESARLTVPPGTIPGFLFPGVFPPGSYNAASGPLSYTQQLLNGPRPGWSQWYDPFSTSALVAAGYGYWVNDPVALARFSDIRPGLLTPPNVSSTPFFFDFLDSYLPGSAPGALHLPTGHGSPSDLHSRGMLTTDLAGHPYYAGTATFPWQVTGLPQSWQGAGFTNYWSAVMTDFAASEYAIGNEMVLNEGTDTQYEMDLTQNARQGGQNTGNTAFGIPDYAGVDGKLGPSELEGILRTYEQGASGAADSSSLLQRLDNLETAHSLSATQLYSLLTNRDATIAGPPNKISPRNDIRLATTTESWDLPMPNIALTPRQMQDVIQYVTGYLGNTAAANALVNPTKMLNLNSVGLADLVRARIFVDNCDSTTNMPSPLSPMFSFLSLVSGADLQLFGNLKNIQPNLGLTMPPVPIWPLLAPETVLGMRLDVNRLLGNGVDDNGNGVVDEPLEVMGLYANGFGEALVYPYSQINTAVTGPAGQVNSAVTMPNGAKQNDMLGILDLNNDGFYPVTTGGSTSLDPQTGALLPADPTYADMRARQLLAKHLYCLAMLLLDDRPNFNATATGPYGATEMTTQSVMAQIFSAAGPTPGYYHFMGFPTGTPLYYNVPPLPSIGATASREQAAYVIAQWAVNVVDFRDRDSIMTPFEFDLYPFRADDPTLPNVTWNVDDIIDPFFVATGGATPQPGSRSDDTAIWRGLVWGCERPELLMTETVGFHDRGTADTTGAQQINDQTQNPATGNDTVSPTTDPTVINKMPYDKDFDQVRRPRGSLIVELFNPTNYWDAPQADMQQPWQAADANGNRGMGVNLAQVAAGQPLNNPVGPVASPVWRIVVAYSPSGWQANESLCYNNTPAGATIPVGGGGYTNSPGNSSYYIDQRVPVLAPGAIHRAVYFTPYQPGFVTGGGSAATVGDTLLNSSFFADPDIIAAAAPNLLLPPGQYALVGPATADPAGSGTYNIYAGQNNMTGGNANNWKLQLAAAAATPRSIAFLSAGTGGVLQLQGPYATGYTGVTATSGSIKPVVGVPIQTNWYTGSGSLPVYVPHSAAGTLVAGTPVATTLRMSVSEPEHGYPVWLGGAVAPVTASGSTPPALLDDATYSAPGLGPFPQHPFDSAQGNPAGGNYLQFNDLPNPYVAPSGSVGTRLGYTVLYLQRLANPLQAWDQKMNPYITVDSMPVDLTAYTGETAMVEPATYYTSTNPINQPNPQPTGYANWKASGGTDTSFDTRRRGWDATGASTLLADQSTPNIWTPLPVGGTNVYTGGKYRTSAQGSLTSPMTASTGSTGSTLGWINYEYSGGTYYSTGGTNNPTSKMGTSGMPPYMYNGDPTTSFPWLAWNNRPYVSQYELMLVPASSPSSQAQDFGMLGWNGAATLNEYQPYTTTGVVTPGQILTPVANTLPAAQFMQLLNFFNNEQSLTTTDTTNALPNLYRIFEFLQVPSRYTGTQEMLSPSQFAGDNAVSTVSGATGGVVNAAVSHLFHTPFNWLPRYREPGRINLNTIFDPVVFQCLMDDYPGSLFAYSLSNLNPVTGLADLNPMTGLADAMVWPRGLFASMTQSRQGFYVDPTRTYMWNGTYTSLIPVIGTQFLVPGAGPSYTVNSTGTPVPNPSAPPNPVSQFAYNTSAAMPGINADVPTYFANPFRPDGAAAFVPPTGAYAKLMHQWNYPPSPTNLTPINNSINATLLRSQDGATFNSFPTVENDLTKIAAPPTPGPLAMFDDTSFDTNNLGAIYSTTGTSYRHPARNATFQYQMFNRLGNTVTNRSNVYAIWITLGKFQVQPVAPNPVNPDGYKIVQPYLDAQGNQAQTRGFYIFDRSIPMGFQRGQDLNIEKGMLVEKVLQVP